ncbi:MAG: S9 family peptidase [Bryobacteraceae bacterium]|nr:S9 family peptidase [Bryobacteraceae bacterium]
MKPRFLPALLCSGLLCSLALRAQGPAAWTPEFAMQFRGVSAVAPSPDGKMAVWVETRQVMDTERSETESQIFAGSVDGSRRVQLTRGEKSSNAPAWSPDGKTIYFASARSGKRQVYRIRLAGGEAEQVTEFKGDVSDFLLSRDGTQLAFTGYEPAADEEKARKEKRDWEVLDTNPKNEAVYVVPADPDPEGKRSQRRLTDGQQHVTEFNWSPDGKNIAFVRQASPKADDWIKSELAEVDLGSGAVKIIGPARTFRGSNPSFSPDGRWLAYAKSTQDPPKWAFESEITLLNRQSGQSRVLPATFDEQPRIIGWSPDSSRILFSEARGTRTVIYEMPVDGPPRARFEPKRGVLNGITLNTTGSALGFEQETPEEAAEAYVLALDAAAPVRVSSANVNMPKLPLGRTEVMRWKSKDGRDVEGLVTYPVGFEKGRKYPLILNIHGGPTGVFNEGFIGKSGIYPLASLAARGYVILRPNPRGSSGYGREFRFANYNDWGGMDYEDDMAGVDALIAQGVADPDRMAVMGWSYGGFMTNWIITRTQRFKAAVSGAGLSNLWSFTGTADVPGFIPDYFGGEPHKAFENYQKHSPLTFANQVTTPVLFLHGEKDDRVPPSQAVEYYNALKRRGVITRLVTYPRTPHGPREPKFVLDIMQRHLDWVDKYVR